MEVRALNGHVNKSTSTCSLPRCLCVCRILMVLSWQEESLPQTSTMELHRLFLRQFCFSTFLRKKKQVFLAQEVGPGLENPSASPLKFNIDTKNDDNDVFFFKMYISPFNSFQTYDYFWISILVFGGVIFTKGTKGLPIRCEAKRLKGLRSSRSNRNSDRRSSVGLVWRFAQLQDVHPRNLTWNLKITQLKRKIIFQTIIFRFHVNLPGVHPRRWTKMMVWFRCVSRNFEGCSLRLSAVNDFWV